MKGVVMELSEMTESREIIESKESPIISIFVIMLAFLVAAASVFSCFFEIDDYARMSGEIKTVESSSSVIIPGSCKISRICAAEGQTVKCGDVIFILDADYAREQKEVLENKLEKYQKDLNDLTILRESVNAETNMFGKDGKDSEYYYRFEQYMNNVKANKSEAQNTAASKKAAGDENELTLKGINSDIKETNALISEYSALLNSVRSDSAYVGSNNMLSALYQEYNTNYKKACTIYDQYKSTYDDLYIKYDSGKDQPQTNYTDVEKAKQECETAENEMNTCRENFLGDLRVKISFLENKADGDSMSEEQRRELDDYHCLKDAIERGTNCEVSTKKIQSEFDVYNKRITELSEKHANALSVYCELYNDYTQSSTASSVTEADVLNAENLCKSAAVDTEAVKSAFISKVSSSMSAAELELKNLEKQRASLELSLKNDADTDEASNISKDKLKNDTIISINTETGTVNENIAAIKSQIAELTENIDDSEIKASIDGVITLIGEINEGDIVQAGASLCTIVPKSEQLKVTLYIPESEALSVKVGQKTEYTISESVKMSGEILSISADSVYQENIGGSFYVAQASLFVPDSKNGSETYSKLKSGIVVNARVITGSKTAIKWLAEKIK